MLAVLTAFLNSETEIFCLPFAGKALKEYRIFNKQLFSLCHAPAQLRWSELALILFPSEPVSPPVWTSSEIVEDQLLHGFLHKEDKEDDLKGR
jgi:hypothetical protein